LKRSYQLGFFRDARQARPTSASTRDDADDENPNQ